MSSRYCGAIPPEPIHPRHNCVGLKGHAGQHWSIGREHHWDGNHAERLAPLPIIIREDGDEEHPSWLLVGVSRLSSTGTDLFDSEIRHHSLIRVTVRRAKRRRDLNHDWIHGAKVIMEFDMSESQWGAFVSSFNRGEGVPATLTRFEHADLPVGETPDAPLDRRLDRSHNEVREAGDRALAEVQEAYAAVEEAYERKAGRKEMNELLRTLKARLSNAPANMEFAAKSLTEHVENVVTKARADIEGMAYGASGQRAPEQIEDVHYPKLLP